MPPNTEDYEDQNWMGYDEGEDEFYTFGLKPDSDGVSKMAMNRLPGGLPAPGFHDRRNVTMTYTKAQREKLWAPGGSGPCGVGDTPWLPCPGSQFTLSGIYAGYTGETKNNNYNWRGQFLPAYLPQECLPILVTCQKGELCCQQKNVIMDND